MRRYLVVVCPLMLGLAACGSKKTADQQVAAADPEATATATPAAVGSVGAAVSLPLTAQAFIDAVAASDKFEMESARLVQGSGTGPQLTAFTQMMLRDHKESTNELEQAANVGAGSAFTDKQKLTDEQQANIEALRNAGSKLAAVYLRQQVIAHEKALAILKTYAASGDNHALMAFAAKMVPIVSHHLDEAKKLAAAEAAG